MSIAYTEPLSKGWKRMTKALFQPFDISKWFIVGFTAFLAGLTDYHGGGRYDNNSLNRNRVDLDEFFRFPDYAWDWLTSNTLWFTLIIFGIFFIFAITLVLTWLSSRGKFMFLYNVTNDDSKISKPWKEYSREGNSLFVWRFLFGLVSFGIVMASIIFSFIFFRDVHFGYVGIAGKVLAVFGIVLQFLIIIIVIGYISVFLDDFIVPVMYKHRLTATQAWKKFMPTLSRHVGHFILYGLFRLALIIIAAICVVIFGVTTCCIGFVVLIIPYIGSVLILPITYTLRAFSVEFLEQFGPDYKIFPLPEEIGEQ
ncbi:MAG: hypothetical protein K8R53_06995 [Bacteroidales bacterium]|nr:hypothetical protein [Bacteroidales bacterium]